MRGGESFLARWSRRKHAGAVRSDAGEHPPPGAPQTVEDGPPTTDEAPPAVPLPPIEAIESASDVRAFLAPGVPLELTRAALRRAWRIDPAIRDFIGLSENAWDFDAPEGVPGFGSLDLDEVCRLVAQILDEPRVTDPTSAAAAVAEGPATPADAGPETSGIPSRESIAAEQHKNEQSKGCERRRHHHGGALPQ
jgi:Protein of unknown function (DUF3306)